MFTVDSHGRNPWKPNLPTTYLKFVSVLQEEKYDKNDVVPKLIQTDMGNEFQKIKELNEFEGKSYRTFLTGNRDMKATMVERLIGQLKLISRVLNILNNSDLGTYLTFLDAILECYNESPHSQLGAGRMPFDIYRKGVVVPKNFLYKRFFDFHFLMRKILHKVSESESVLWKICFRKEALVNGLKKCSWLQKFI